MSPKHCEICGDETTEWIESFDGYRVYICENYGCIITAFVKRRNGMSHIKEASYVAVSKIDWRTVWKLFEEWYNETPRSWTGQKRKLKTLIEKHVKVSPDYVALSQIEKD